MNHKAAGKRRWKEKRDSEARFRRSFRSEIRKWIARVPTEYGTAFYRTHPLFQ